jgi:hypothetical protein
MKIHLIRFPDREDTQPIDVENIMSIGCILEVIDGSYRNNPDIFGYHFYIFPKIGQSFHIFYQSEEHSKGSDKKNIDIKQFLIEQRDQLIQAWTTYKV